LVARGPLQLARPPSRATTQLLSTDVTTVNTRTRSRRRRPMAATGTAGRGVSLSGVVLCCTSWCCSPELERSAVMSAVQASRSGPGWPRRRPCSSSATALGLGATGNTLHGMAGEPHRTRYNTLQLTSTGPLHCCFWCAGSGSGATAIQSGEVHHAKRGATGAHSMRSGATCAHSMRSGATGAHSMRSGAAGALEHA